MPEERIAEQRWVLVDTETDGLLAPIHVLEIAAQMMEGWEPVGKPFQVFLNHDVAIPPQVVAIHGYTRDFLSERGQPPRDAHEAFRQYAGNHPIVAHNLAYDWNRALGPEWARLGLPPAGCRGFCTMALARRVVSETASYGLDVLKAQFELGGAQSHKALADVQTVARLFSVVLRPRLEAAGLTTFQEWAEFSRRTPISECLALVNPNGGNGMARPYFLPPTVPTSTRECFTKGAAFSFSKVVTVLAKRVEAGGELPAIEILRLKSLADASLPADRVGAHLSFLEA